MLRIFKLASDMADSTRWSNSHCFREESVLEHTGFVAVYALHLAYKYDINIGQVLEKAVVHDMEETETGDILTSVKYANDDLHALIKALEDEAALKISGNVFDGHMYQAWYTSKDLGTPSGQVVYIADMAAVVYKIAVEIGLGNHKFKEYIDGIINRINESHTVINEEFHPELQLLAYQVRILK